MGSLYENPEIAINYEKLLKKRKDYCIIEKKFLEKEIKKNMSVLDLGCGISRHAFLFGKKGKYTGIDISNKMIEVAKQKCKKKKINARFIKGDIKNLEKLIKGKFDLILLMYHTLGCINLKKDRIKLFKKIKKKLKKDGKLIIHVHNRNHIKNIKFLFSSLFSSCEFGNKKIKSGKLAGIELHFFSKRELEKELKKAGLKIIERINLEYPDEGKIAKGIKKLLLTGGYFFKVTK